MTNKTFRWIFDQWGVSVTILGLSCGLYIGCSSRNPGARDTESGDNSRNRTETQRADARSGEPRSREPRSGESGAAESEVQVQVARAEAQRRAELLQDAKTALEQTH